MQGPKIGPGVGLSEGLDLEPTAGGAISLGRRLSRDPAVEDLEAMLETPRQWAAAQALAEPPAPEGEDEGPPSDDLEDEEAPEMDEEEEPEEEESGDREDPDGEDLHLSAGLGELALYVVDGRVVLESREDSDEEIERDPDRAIFVGILVLSLERLLDSRLDRLLRGLRRGGPDRLGLVGISELAEAIDFAGANRETKATWVSGFVNSRRLVLPDGRVVKLAHLFDRRRAGNRALNDAILRAARRAVETEGPPGNLKLLARAVMKSEDELIQEWVAGLAGEDPADSAATRLKRVLANYCRRVPAQEAGEEAFGRFARRVAGGGRG